MKIGEVINQVRRGWKFNKDNYPLYSDALDDQEQFQYRHVLLHLNITIGKISIIFEEIDHGKQNDNSNKIMRKQILNLMITTFKLADLVGYSSEDIERDISSKYSN